MTIRAVSAVAVFAIMMLWEFAAPRRRLIAGRWPRWPGNFGIFIVDILAVRLLVPTAAVGFALIAEANRWGLLHSLALPFWAQFALAFLALDLIIYLQHRLFHAVPVLWRLHRVHHADVDIDVTTGNRFHPFEILLSLAIKIAAVIALGVPPAAVVAFEVVLNATSMFNHSNVALPAWLEPVARWAIVTPQMHEVHHSVERVETDSNFGFNLPWWDRLFRTYRAAPKAGAGVVIGLDEFRDARERNLIRLLTQPFRNSREGEPGAPAR